VGIDREVGESLLEAKKEVYIRTGASITRLRQNKDRSEYIKLYNERSVINGI